MHSELPQGLDMSFKNVLSDLYVDITLHNPRELVHVHVSLHIFFRLSSESKVELHAIYITVIRKTADVIELRKTTGVPVNLGAL